MRTTAIIGLFLLLASLSGQTRLNYKTQVREQPTIAVIEKQICNWFDATHDCRGMEYYRFRLADGTVLGPYVAVKPDSQFVLDPARWTPVTITTSVTGGTKLPIRQIK